MGVFCWWIILIVSLFKLEDVIMNDLKGTIVFLCVHYMTENSGSQNNLIHD